MAWTGHLWTVLPTLLQRVQPATAPPTRPWSTRVSPEPGGQGDSIRLTGKLREHPGADTLVLVVHGLGGGVDTHYCVRAANVIDARGWSCLRLFLRGADRLGEDFYHAGLVADLEAALRSPELARYRRLFILGYSLGGHVTLHAALEPVDPRLAAVAAVCAPLDLQRGAGAIDRRRATVYRRHVLAGLKEIYERVAARRPVPTPVERIRRVRTIREWDALTVVPRYGFASVEDYYERMSAGPRLGALRRPTLLVPSRHDPMVPAWTFEDHLAAASRHLTVHWVEGGGHVGYPPRIALEGQRVASIEAHILAWFASQEPG
ncbi:MAG TPA: alpha/beta fold hydrolase [Polyangia bacterium]|jgi:hypothetical protein|nr:alpha/beta fold hydrolase [Polyangia bacterium]